ncbi:ABC transporter permease [Micromonospora sediminimaris]|uniref:Transport permease protein n=1 Tax=Micromonospora sediminimaris TaxID=547162 RepID=A0A9W5UVH4_9ACTN|nr:ABC transporter permease [Micromonospora sediminimaris]GIJ35817.1 transport permease protein [Micromonospora sediminimaris]SFC57769.1 ABC-2 type transport system permease protein [Micromonospora sediminimaris]
MSPLVVAARAGLSRGRIELRQSFTNAETLWGYLFPTVVLLVVMFFLRGAKVPGTEFSLGAQTLPSTLGMTVAFGGLVTMASILTVEREDGTLLRAKATPNGMFGYLISKITLVSGMTLVSVALLLVPGLFLFDVLALDSIGAWLTLAWVMLVGMVATMPVGAVFGSLLSNPRNMGLIMLPMMGLIATSGIFYPITAMPGWLQAVAQVFPIYWLGLGMRSALLPEAMAAVELGDSWRHLETLLVLGGWAVAGLVLAPVVLRRMARRESGSSVAARREKAMQRVT